MLFIPYKPMIWNHANNMLNDGLSSSLWHIKNRFTPHEHTLRPSVKAKFTTRCLTMLCLFKLAGKERIRKLTFNKMTIKFFQFSKFSNNLGISSESSQWEHISCDSLFSSRNHPFSRKSAQAWQPGFSGHRFHALSMSTGWASLDTGVFLVRVNGHRTLKTAWWHWCQTSADKDSENRTHGQYYPPTSDWCHIGASDFLSKLGIN